MRPHPALRLQRLRGHREHEPHAQEEERLPDVIEGEAPEHGQHHERGGAAGGAFAAEEVQGPPGRQQRQQQPQAREPDEEVPRRSELDEV
jgi:hypothetical protein